MFIGSVLSYHSVSSWNAIYPLQCQDHALCPCPCPCPSLLVPVPCSSDLLVPGHQVRTVLLLETTCSPSFTEKVRGAVWGMEGIHMDTEFPQAAGEWRRKGGEAFNSWLYFTVQNIFSSWKYFLISNLMLLFLLFIHGATMKSVHGTLSV